MSTNAKDIQLTEQQREQLAAIVDQTGKPWDELFAEFIANVRLRQKPTANGEQRRSAFEAFDAVGAIGCIEGPGDLSTNPKYMEGFGTNAKRCDTD